MHGALMVFRGPRGLFLLQKCDQFTAGSLGRRARIYGGATTPAATLTVQERSATTTEGALSETEFRPFAPEEPAGDSHRLGCCRRSTACPFHALPAEDWRDSPRIFAAGFVRKRCDRRRLLSPAR